MSKLILTGLSAAIALGLAACGGREEANVEMNAEEMAPADNMMADENMADMNMSNDMNMTGNMDESTGNATGNEAIDNTTNSY